MAWDLGFGPGISFLVGSGIWFGSGFGWLDEAMSQPLTTKRKKVHVKPQQICNHHMQKLLAVSKLIGIYKKFC